MHWLVIPISILALWFEAAVIHEGAHILAGRWFEARRLLRWHWYPKIIHPDPRRPNLKKLMFSGYELTEPETNYPVTSPVPRFIAPAYAGTIWGILWSFALAAVPQPWKLLLAPFAVVGFGDLVFFWICYFKGSEFSDAKRYREAQRS